MAFVSQPLPPNEQNQNAQSGTTTPNPLALLPPNLSQTGGSSGVGTGSGQGTSTQFGTSASKLSDYLSANSPAIQQNANQIAGNLTNQYNSAMGDINKLSSGFQNQVSSGYTPYSQGQIDQAAANPAAFAKDPNNVKAFQGMYNDSYTGPASIESTAPYSNVQNEVNTAVQNASMWNNPSGIATQISGIENNPSPGMNTLDSLLLQMNPQAISTVQNAAQPFSGLTNYLSNAATNADALVSPAQQAAQQARTAAQTAGNKASGDFANKLNTNYQNTIQKDIDYNNELNSITSKIGANNLAGLTPAEQNMIGFNPAILPIMDKYASIFPTQAQNNPLTPNQFFTPGAQAPVAQPSDIVSPDDIATFQALQMLTGNAPGVNFTMPTASTQGTAGATQALSGQPGQLPSYNNMGVLGQIESSYQPLYQQLIQTGFPNIPSNQAQGIIDYMNSVSNLANTPQPSPMPTTPPPAPGTNGDLGNGFHWDPSSASWQPTVSLGGTGTGGTTTTGGGHVAR